MIIDPISSGLSSSVLSNPILDAPSKAASPAPVSTPTISATADPTASAQSTISPAVVANFGGGQASGEASASSSPSGGSPITSYSTIVAGTQYAGTVQESEGEYLASIPSIFEATATGSCPVAAETNLNIRINEML